VNIVIDQGNTLLKIALFEEGRLLTVFSFESFPEDWLQKTIQDYRPQKGILSAVKQVDPLLLSFLQSHIPYFYELNVSTPLPLRLDYKTPHTLGMDRIAAATGAYVQKPSDNLFVIDIGTAITLDYVEKGVYKGGNISPGPEIRFKALHDHTSRLPLLDENGEIPDLGYDTETAIRSGVIDGIVREIDSYVDEYKKKYNVFAFLTGGYSFYFETRLKNSIFADENLVLKGLNEILNYQEKFKK
jgi:type III pantothenate kinase